MKRIISLKSILASWAIPTAIFTVFVLLGARAHPLWSDESGTALFAKSILVHGMPNAWDGVNLIGNGVGYNKDFLLTMIPLLQLYIAALSFRLFGIGTFTARLPFVIFSLITIPMVYAIAKYMTRSTRAAALSSYILALSVPYILFAYQARYYSLMALSGLVGLYSVVKIGEKKKWYWLVLFVALTVYIYAHPVSFPAYAISLGVSSALALVLQKKNVFPFVWKFAGITLSSFMMFLPTVLQRIPPVNQVHSAVITQQSILQSLRSFWNVLIQYHENNAFPMLLIVLLVLALRRVSTLHERRMAIVRVGVMVCVYFFVLFLETILIGASSEYSAGESRYNIVLLPLFAILSGSIFDFWIGAYRRIGWVCYGIFLITTLFTFGPLRVLLYEYIGEMVHPYITPSQAVSGYLNAHAVDGQTIFINSDREHEPLIFYLSKRLKFINRLHPANPTFFPADEVILPRYIYAFTGSPDWVVLYSKYEKSDTLFTYDLRSVFPKGLYPSVNLARDYDETVLPVFFADTTRPELFNHAFAPFIPEYNDQIFIYKKRKI